MNAGKIDIIAAAVTVSDVTPICLNTDYRYFNLFIIKFIYIHFVEKFQIVIVVKEGGGGKKKVQFLFSYYVFVLKFTFVFYCENKYYKKILYCWRAILNPILFICTVSQ